MKKVLFVCIHNSARSQMAEAYLNKFGQGQFEAQSAGIEPGKLNSIVVKAMTDDGIDISQNSTNSVQEFLDQAAIFDFIITVCDETSAERCPVFPGLATKLHWGFPDPSSFSGDEEKRLKRTVEVRDAIKSKIQDWLAKGEF